MTILKASRIPRATIRRLAVYLQTLERLRREGVEVISSEQLAQACDTNASQIRKDLTYFGEFGIRGVGYNIAGLIQAIRVSLNIERQWNCVLIGVGNMGRALLNHREFRQRNYVIVGAFDCDPFKIGEEISGLEITCSQRLKEKVPALSAEIGIITTPPERAQKAADQLVEAGIKGILNFASARISTPEHIFVEYVDFFYYLYSLSFNISQSPHK